MLDESTDISVHQNQVDYDSGVVKRLGGVAQSLLVTHYIAHWLALGTGGVANQVGYIARFQEHTNGL